MYQKLRSTGLQVLSIAHVPRLIQKKSTHFLHKNGQGLFARRDFFGFRPARILLVKYRKLAPLLNIKGSDVGGRQYQKVNGQIAKLLRTPLGITGQTTMGIAGKKLSSLA